MPRGVAELLQRLFDRRCTEWDVVEFRERPPKFGHLVAESDGDGVVGWTTFAPFSERECYRGIGYFSVYVDPGMRRLGVGRQLLRALVDEARRRGYRKLVSGIFVSNAASRALCAACGWREVGIYQRHAQLDGRWIDVVIVEQLL